MSIEGQPKGVRAVLGQSRHRGRLREELSIDLACDVSFERSDDLGFRSPLGEATLQVGDGARIAIRCRSWLPARQLILDERLDVLAPDVRNGGRHPRSVRKSVSFVAASRYDRTVRSDLASARRWIVSRGVV